MIILHCGKNDNSKNFKTILLLFFSHFITNIQTNRNTLLHYFLQNIKCLMCYKLFPRIVNFQLLIQQVLFSSNIHYTFETKLAFYNISNCKNINFIYKIVYLQFSIHIKNVASFFFLSEWCRLCVLIVQTH